MMKFSFSYQKGIHRNTWRLLARICHTPRYFFKKQQILFLSSAKAESLEESRERKGKLDSRVHPDSLDNI